MILDDYKNYLIIDRHYSNNTVNSYINDLSSYISYLDNKNISYKNASNKDILSYISNINYLDERTIAHQISVLRSFYKFLILEGKVKTNPTENIDLPKLTKKLPNVLSIEDINKLLDINLNNMYDYRNKAMLELLYATGLRVSELVNLKLEDIDLYNATLRTIGKGSKMRILPFGNYASDALNKYITEYRSNFIKKEVSDYLFLNNHGKKMTRQGFFKILNSIAKDKGIKEISPHMIRHSFATHMLSGGADLRSIQELLGHANLATTEIYTNISRKEIENNYHNTHPHGGK